MMMFINVKTHWVYESWGYKIFVAYLAINFPYILELSDISITYLGILGDRTSICFLDYL